MAYVTLNEGAAAAVIAYLADRVDPTRLPNP
jgi:hypothetical protein